MNTRDIGKFISAKRREKNLTQEQLAERLGVSNKTISKWENGKCLPDYSVIEALCRELSVTVAELLGGQDAKNANPPNEEQYQMLQYKVQQMESRLQKAEQERIIINDKTKVGITFGSALAMVISYAHWHSIGWAILHGLFSWGYVIYYLIKY